MHKQQTKNLDKQQGFTLMEILVAVGLFAITMTIVTQIFMMTNKTQRRVATYQRVQSDLRVMMSLIVEKVRISNIDYEFPGYVGGVTNPNETLALIDVDDQKVIFRLSDTNFANTTCPDTKSVPCVEMSMDGGVTYNSITSQGVRVKSLNFYINPTIDPFTLNGADYDSDEQPHVTIQGEFESINLRDEDRVTLPFQTTIAARIYRR